MSDDPTKHNISVSVHSSVTVDATLDTHPQKLLRAARRFIDDGEFGMAVVVAHTACEIATERSLSEAFASKGIPYLAEPITELFISMNLGNPRLRKLYTALSGDDVATQGFWQHFKASADRRNAVVHNGVEPGKSQAEASYKAAVGLVTHLKK
jgi:hypothetical protein